MSRGIALKVVAVLPKLSDFQQRRYITANITDKRM